MKESGENSQRSFISKWQELFNPENKQKISLEQICKVRRLDIKEARKEYGPLPEVLQDVTIIESDMPENLKISVCETISEGFMNYTDDEPEFVRHIKKTLDKKHGKPWHVTVIVGRYCSFYTYEMGYNFVFKRNNRIFLIYKTPDCT
ncbi:unnamed protein product [Calicophoron daubneyi]|uniref:Dynein light chain n=1 Tax=Calicophoron daubneyi TaxID=300641 RepID=A0AAV2TUG0_CALDB